MIPLRWSKVSNYDGTPILKDVEIDALTEILLEYYLGNIALAPILNKNSITIRLVA